MSEIKNTTVRLDPEIRKEVDRVAKIYGITASDVVRMCVKYGLPLVEQGFQQMGAFLEEKLAERQKPLAKGKK